MLCLIKIKMVDRNIIIKGATFIKINNNNEKSNEKSNILYQKRDNKILFLHSGVFLLAVIDVRSL